MKKRKKKKHTPFDGRTVSWTEHHDSGFERDHIGVVLKTELLVQLQDTGVVVGVDASKVTITA